MFTNRKRKEREIVVEHGHIHKWPSDYMVLPLPLGNCVETFNLEKAVCNHGLFMMAPNLWIPSSKILQRPLRLADGSSSVVVSIYHPLNLPSLHIRVHANHLSSSDQQAILEQVARILRISDKDEQDVREFQMLNPKAKVKAFGRLFRSPTLFEDAVKSILFCNCTWSRTLEMARTLCELQFDLSAAGLRRFIKHSSNKETTASSTLHVQKFKPRPLGNFPNSRELAGLPKDFLVKHCNLGYRAKTILVLAQRVEKMKLQLQDHLVTDLASLEVLNSKLKKVKGIGNFTTANISMCLGFYHLIPVDTETIKHLQKIHDKESSSMATVQADVQQVYDKSAPFQCLAYWLEQVEYYESKLGKLSDLPPSSYYTVASSSKCMS
ncbi:hypothetical protein Ancab_005666 [Ancistrocladus abbreviatus]